MLGRTDHLYSVRVPLIHSASLDDAGGENGFLHPWMLQDEGKVDLPVSFLAKSK